MINRLVEPHDVIVVQGGNFHCIYSSLHRACQKKPVACNHCQQTLTGILSTHTHTHTPSLARSLELCLLTAAGPPQGSCEVKICYIMQPCIDFPPLEVGQLPARSETGDESC